MKLRLLGAVLAAVAAVWLVTAVLSYRDARRQIDELLDAHLAQAAALLVAQASHELDEIETEHSPALHPYGHRVAFQVWERGRTLRVHSADAPDTRLSPATDGFSDSEAGGRRWRVFSTWTRKRRLLIQVGEERAAREQLAAAIARNILTPMVLALPVLAGLVWLGVRWGTRPLAILSRQAMQRDPTNLAPFGVVDPPAEVAPLVESLNRLLARVRSSIEGERRFTADAAHELRTPIAAVRAHAEVALAAAGEPERRVALESIIVGCDRAAHGIDQLLTLARLDPGDAGPGDRCDLRDVAKQVLADVAPMALARGVEVELAADTAMTINGHAPLLAILVRNLVDNAIRYGGPGGGVRVHVVRDGAIVRLVVCDDGPGVPAAERATLGERFRRLPGSGETGSGLGLSIVKRIAELHRAVVRFEPGPGGRGLSVVVEFPGAPAL